MSDDHGDGDAVSGQSRRTAWSRVEANSSAASSTADEDAAVAESGRRTAWASSSTSLTADEEDTEIDRPNSRPRRWKALLGLVIPVTVVLIIGVLVLRPWEQWGESSPTQTQPAQPSSESRLPTSEPTLADDSTPEPTFVDAEIAALQELEALRENDLMVTPLAGQWVAQVASKAPGIFDPFQTTADGSHVFQAVDILAEHEALRARFDQWDTSVILLLSTDYGTRKTHNGEPMWVTFVTSEYFTDEATVDTWCRESFPAVSGRELTNSCLPRTLDPPV
jgi:hypothetical protein